MTSSNVPQAMNKELLKKPLSALAKVTEIVSEIDPTVCQSLESLIGLQYKKTLFDSAQHNWSKNTSLFDRKIHGKRHLVNTQQE